MTPEIAIFGEILEVIDRKEKHYATISKMGRRLRTTELDGNCPHDMLQSTFLNALKDFLSEWKNENFLINRHTSLKGLL